MTDKELQDAIDKTTVHAHASGPLRELHVQHLKELYKIQIIRASASQSPGIRPGAIVQIPKEI